MRRVQRPPPVESTSVTALVQHLESLDVATVAVPSLSKIGSNSRIPTPNQLCRLCEAVFDGVYEGNSHRFSPKYWIHHHSESDLEDSASDGCHLCNLILYALQKKRQPGFEDQIADVVPKDGFGRQIGLGIQFSSGQGAIAIVAPNSETSPYANPMTYIHFTHDLGKITRQKHPQPHVVTHVDQVYHTTKKSTQRTTLRE
jgi:hypothetical protein